MDDFGTSIGDKEGTGSVGDLGIADAERSLPNECSMLITQNRRELGSSENTGTCTDPSNRRDDLWQHRHGHTDRFAEIIVPGERLEVHEHGSAGVRDVRDMQPRQIPRKPRVNGSKGELTAGSPRSQIGVLVQDPPDLGPRKVRCWGKPGTRTERFRPEGA